MATSEYETTRSGGGSWFFITLALLLFLGGALSVGAYIFGHQELTILESIIAGFGGLAGLIVGLIGAAIGIIVGLFGALLGIVAAGRRGCLDAVYRRLADYRHHFVCAVDAAWEELSRSDCT